MVFSCWCTRCMLVCEEDRNERHVVRCGYAGETNWRERIYISDIKVFHLGNWETMYSHIREKVRSRYFITLKYERQMETMSCSCCRKALMVFSCSLRACCNPTICT